MTDRPNNPTLVHVAKAAGVSVSTAARVLRKAEYPVDARLRGQVEAAAKAIGYVPNLVARRLRGGGKEMVGLIVGNMLDAHYGVIAEVVTERAESAHSTVAIVCNMQRDPLLELKYCRQLFEYRVAGLILSGGGFDQWTHQEELSDTIDELRRAGIAVASLTPRRLNAPVFSVDNLAVGATIANFVVENGHSKVCILLGPARNEMTRLRMQSIVEVLSGNMVGFSISHIESTPDAGAASAEEMLAQDRSFTAFICGSDAIAFGVLERLKIEGINVPSQIAVIGLGNTRLAKISSPRLATIETNFEMAGRTALDYIVAAKDSPASGEGMVLPHHLVKGESFCVRNDDHGFANATT